MQLAKQRYSADVPVVTVYDEKVLQDLPPVGPQNRFLLAGEDQGQPTLFPAGGSTANVSAPVDLLVTGWNLGATIAVATVFTRRC